MRARVYTADSESHARRINTNRSLAGEPGVRIVDGGVILPLQRAPGGSLEEWHGGVVDRGGQFVAGHRVHPTRDHKLNVTTAYPVPTDMAYRAEAVVYAGGGSLGHFGHLMTEGLARLWWLFEQDDAGMNIALSAVDLTHDHPNIRLLVQAGVAPERILLLREPTRFDEVIVPDQAFFLGSGEYFPGRATAVYDAIRGSVTPGSMPKVYLTRTAFRDPLDRIRERGEPMIEDVYRSQGFEIVAPETLSLPDQIAAVAGAGEIASTVGTLSHWVLVARDGVQQDAILRHPMSVGLDGQWGMSAMRSAELSVVTTTLDMVPGSRWAGVVTHAATPDWVHFTRDRFGIDVPLDDLTLLLPQYLRDWVELITSLPEEQLNFIPAWTVADFAEHFSRQLIGRPLDAETRVGLDRRYPKR